MHMYGRDLAEAFEWLQRYQKTKDTTDLHQAWEYYFLVRTSTAHIQTMQLYNLTIHFSLSLSLSCLTRHQVFRNLSTRLPNIKTIEMQHVSPKLMAVRDLGLIVPGIPPPPQANGDSKALNHFQTRASSV